MTADSRGTHQWNRLVKDAEIKALFEDPRWRHLITYADFEDDEAEQLNRDRTMTLQASIAVYSMRSAEKQSAALSRATWVLAGATVGLVVATIVLVVATVSGGQ